MIPYHAGITQAVYRQMVCGDEEVEWRCGGCINPDVDSADLDDINLSLSFNVTANFDIPQPVEQR